LEKKQQSSKTSVRVKLRTRLEVFILTHTAMHPGSHFWLHWKTGWQRYCWYCLGYMTAGSVTTTECTNHTHPLLLELALVPQVLVNVW